MGSSNIFFPLVITYLGTVIVILAVPTKENQLNNSKLQEAFLQPLTIMYGVLCSVAVTIPILLEFCVDYLDDLEKHHILERLSMLLIIIIPGCVILSYRESPGLAYSFACWHSLQLVGSCAPVLSILNNLAPLHFTRAKIFFSYLFCVLAGITSIIGFESSSHEYYINILTMVFSALSFGILINCSFSWLSRMRHVLIRKDPENTINLLKNFNTLSVNDKCCLLYLLCWLMTIIIIPLIIGCTRKFSWLLVTREDICLSVFSLVVFTVVPSCIPGRLVRIESKLRAHALKTNHSTVRYISHEIRSPLNIVHNGVDIVLEDLKGKCDTETYEMLQDIRHASKAATSIVDDLLNIEKISMGTFTIEPRLEAAIDNIMGMARRCLPMARQKGINFEYTHSLNTNLPANLTFALNIDCHKIDQVLRNLIVNAFKFTPSGGSVSVNMRLEIPSTTSQYNNDRLNRRTSMVGDEESRFSESDSNFWGLGDVLSPMVIERVMNGDNEYIGQVVIDVVDTGAGIAKDVFDQVFGEFVQFNATKLQVGLKF